MRQTFIETLAELAERDPRIILLTADLGYMVVEQFADRFPERFFNTGVAEQNAVGLAAGLAEAGFLPFVYSMATFASLRAGEFIRNGPVLHNLPVRIVGVGGGFEYGPAGVTHWGLEDVGVLRAQPGLNIIAPADRNQARSALLATWNLPGPAYYRLGKNERDELPELGGRFRLGRVETVFPGRELTFIAMGNIAGEAVRAALSLRAEGVSCGVLVVASVSPAPIEDLAVALRGAPLAVCVEEHYRGGGLGSLVSEVAAGEGIPCRVIRRGVSGLSPNLSGGRDYLRRLHGLDADSLARDARSWIKG